MSRVKVIETAIQRIEAGMSERGFKPVPAVSEEQVAS